MTAKTYLLETVALSALALAPENQRQRDPARVADYAASIEVLGLIHPLSAYREGDKVLVDAGGYRLEALQLLDAANRLPKQYKGGIPTTVWPSKDLARARTVAENDLREPPHFVERIRAYKALLEAKKLPPERIAAACGVTLADVNKMLRLKDVAPAILDAARAGEVPQDVVQAFSIHPDQAVQLAVWEALPSYSRTVWNVKERLRQDTLPARSGLAQFVGREAYEAAGGRFAVDLFAEYGREDWLDADVAWRLADAKLAEVAEAVKAEGWGEVVVNPEDREFWRSFDQLAREPYDLTDDESADYDGAMDTLEDEDATDEERAAAEALIADLDTRMEGVWTDDQKAGGLAFVYMGTGGPQVARGWARPAPVEPVNGPGEDEAHEDDTPLARPAAPTVDHAWEGFGHGGNWHLTKVATASVRCALLAKPAEAYDVLLAHLFIQCFASSSRETPLRITTQGMAVQKGTGDERLDAAEAALAVKRDHWRNRVTGPFTFADVLPVLAALKPKEKADLMAVCVASTFDASAEYLYQQSLNSLRWRGLGAVAQFLGHKVSDLWSAPAAFLGKASKACLLDGLAAVGLSRFSDKDKRDAMAAALAREAGPKGWQPKALAVLTPAPEPEPSEAPLDASETPPEPVLLAAE